MIFWGGFIDSAFWNLTDQNFSVFTKEEMMKNAKLLHNMKVNKSIIIKFNRSLKLKFFRSLLRHDNSTLTLFLWGGASDAPPPVVLLYLTP